MTDDMHPEKLISELSKLDARYNALMLELINIYHFDGIRDVRVNLVKHPRLVIDSTITMLMVRQDNLFDPDWWKRQMDLGRIDRNMTEADQRTFTYGFDTYTKSGYITMLLFGIESEFRFLYVDLFRKNPPLKLSKVSEELLHELQLDDYNNLLRLASNIRNTLHNNGKFIWPDDAVPWRNKTYPFKQEQYLEIDYWETFIIITGDILEMLEKMIKEPRIIEKPAIIDSSYNNV